MVLKLPYCLAHCWHHILLLFYFRRVCRSHNQNCYCKCYCNQKIHFTLGGCCGPGSTTTVTGLPMLRLSSSPCFREYFSLGGCAGLGSYNIFSYCTVYFTLVGCIGLGMSKGVMTPPPMSLELAQWYCWEGLFRLAAFSRAHH